MADADKMRMAGMLASGVAHNFNNLLMAKMHTIKITNGTHSASGFIWKGRFWRRAARAHIGQT